MRADEVGRQGIVPLAESREQGLVLDPHDGTVTRVPVRVLVARTRGGRAGPGRAIPRYASVTKRVRLLLPQDWPPGLSYGACLLDCDGLGESRDRLSESVLVDLERADVPCRPGCDAADGSHERRPVRPARPPGVMGGAPGRRRKPMQRIGPSENGVHRPIVTGVYRCQNVMASMSSHR